jgi:uncharacterized protein (DUF488 family)
MTHIVYTVGHSTMTAERLMGILKQHAITALADVRSQPYSRMNPQFSREYLKEALRENHISYAFLGLELGARSEDRSCYDHGKVQYSRLAQTAMFKKGLARVREGARKHRIALMCAEKEPLECHRAILVSRYLILGGLEVRHILNDGRLEYHADAMNRLIRHLHLPEDDMFRSRDEIISEAYRLQGDRIAYVEKDRPGNVDWSAVG